jgi:hypothetical protein
LCGNPCGVLVTRVIKEKHSNGLSDRLREGKGIIKVSKFILIKEDPKAALNREHN